MKYRLLTSVLTALIIPLALTAPASAERGRVQIVNNNVLADNGWPLRGIHSHLHDFAYAQFQNLSWWRNLRDNYNFNAVRMMGWLYEWPNSSETMDLNKLLPRLDVAVNNAAQVGMYVIIDNHSNCCGSYSRSRNEEFWNAVAPRYKNRTHVIYEIQNEPWILREATTNDIDFEEDMYELIRAHAPDTHIICWSFAQSAPYNKTAVDQGTRIDYSNASVGIHPYHGTDTSSIDAIRADYPSLVTEFGFCCGCTPATFWSYAEATGYSWFLLTGTGANETDLWDVLWPKDPDAVDGGGTPTVNIPEINPYGGTYTDSVTVTLSCSTSGADIRYTVNGSTPDEYSTLYTAPLQITSSLTLKARGFKTDYNPSNVAAATFTITPSSGGMNIPGIIEAEDYNPGGEGVGYHDTTSGNSGGQYRTDDVDIQVCSEGGYSVGWIAIGEWLAFDVDIASAGNYTVTARVASAESSNKTFHLEIDGQDVTGPITFNTGGAGWQTWQDAVVTGVSLPSGTHQLKIAMDTQNFNITYLDITSEGGTFAPGLEAEFFDFTSSLSSMPDLTGLAADVERIDDQINYAATANPWSGLGSEFTDTFASSHIGLVNIETAGDYTFYLNSDDGSYMWLNDELIINNGGLHAMLEKSAVRTLSAGYHDIEIQFFENNGSAGLILSYAGPGISKQVVPASALFHGAVASLKATNPQPADGAPSVSIDTILSWTPGDTAVSHDLYLGTSYSAIENADHQSPEFMGNLAVASFDPDLDFGVTYYWAVDEVNDSNVVEGAGDIWSFTTELDTAAPTPDPMAWVAEPAANGTNAITMTGATAADPSGVEYYFECTAGGGHDSGWQDSASYEDTGLNPGTQYTYRVKARDKSPAQNETGYSPAIAATTDVPADTTPPTPDPLTWAVVPYATGTSSVSMTATTASDPSGVEYYFECTAGGGHDSGWQDSVFYQDTGLDDLTLYSYRVQARDKSVSQNETAWSTTQSATTLDGTSPTPDPLTWSTTPYATGTTSISMTATSASDPSGVEYYFDCTAGGGHDSGWQDSTTYQDTGLSPSTQYTYRVQVRDKSTNQNAGAWSTSESATTDTPPDTTPPTPDPLTWATVPWSTGTTSISMTATTASDPSGLEYYFDCTAGGGNDSGWQDSTAYEDTGLTPDTQYTYRVQARDKSANQNAGGWSTSESATTDAGGASNPVAVFDSGQFHSPWYGATGTGNIPYSLATTPDGQSTPAAWAQRTDPGWTEIRASGSADIADRTFLEFDCYWDTDTNPGTSIAAFHIQVNGDDGWTYKWEGSSQCWIDGNPQTFNPNPTFTGKTWQHFKLDLTTNVQGGTWPTNPDIGVIRIYQANGGGSSLYLNNVEFFGGAPADTNPPTPDPLTWATLPYSTGTASISMTATTASDPSGVEYYFDCTAGGGHDSGWQDGATYEDTGLSPDTQYTYRVQARDKSANQNTGGWASAQAATTDPETGFTYIVFDNAYQNGWTGIGTTSFGGETVLNASGGAWSWHQLSNSVVQDVSSATHFEYQVYFTSAGGGSKIEWHIVSPQGYEWDNTYKFSSPASIDDNPVSLPSVLSTDTWHTVSFNMSGKAWWSADSDSIRYIKWQWPDAATAYIKNVRFVSE